EEHSREVDPGRAAQVACVRHQAMTAEIFREDSLASGDRLLLAHAFETELPPGLFTAFDDEGRGLGLELIGMRPHPAMLGLLEDEGEGIVELLTRAEPHELASPHVDVGLEDDGEGGTRA